MSKVYEGIRRMALDVIRKHGNNGATFKEYYSGMSERGVGENDARSALWWLATEDADLVLDADIIRLRE